MKSSIVPSSCGIALALMTAMVFSHWWSVRGFVGAVDSSTLALAAAPMPAPTPLPAKPSHSSTEIPVSLPAPPATPVQAPDSQQEFFTSLLDEMKQLKRENSTLRNQMAETNRDVMNLEFRVDTHSSQFRPLRVQESIEEQGDFTVPPLSDSGPGVLPPRPTIVALPGDE